MFPMGMGFGGLPPWMNFGTWQPNMPMALTSGSMDPRMMMGNPSGGNVPLVVFNQARPDDQMDTSHHQPRPSARTTPALPREPSPPPATPTQAQSVSQADLNASVAKITEEFTSLQSKWADTVVDQITKKLQPEGTAQMVQDLESMKKQSEEMAAASKKLIQETQEGAKAQQSLLDKILVQQMSLQPQSTNPSAQGSTGHTSSPTPAVAPPKHKVKKTPTSPATQKTKVPDSQAPKSSSRQSSTQASSAPPTKPQQVSPRVKKRASPLTNKASSPTPRSIVPPPSKTKTTTTSKAPSTTSRPLAEPSAPPRAPLPRTKRPEDRRAPSRRHSRPRPAPADRSASRRRRTPRRRSRTSRPRSRDRGQRHHHQRSPTRVHVDRPHHHSNRPHQSQVHLQPRSTPPSKPASSLRLRSRSGRQPHRGDRHHRAPVRLQSKSRADPRTSGGAIVPAPDPTQDLSSWRHIPASTKAPSPAHSEGSPSRSPARAAGETEASGYESAPDWGSEDEMPLHPVEVGENWGANVAAARNHPSRVLSIAELGEDDLPKLYTNVSRRLLDSYVNAAMNKAKQTYPAYRPSEPHIRNVGIMLAQAGQLDEFSVQCLEFIYVQKSQQIAVFQRVRCTAHPPFGEHVYYRYFACHATSFKAVPSIVLESILRPAAWGPTGNDDENEYPSFGFFGAGCDLGLNETDYKRAVNQTTAAVAKIGKGTLPARIWAIYQGEGQHSKQNAGGTGELQRLCQHHGIARGSYWVFHSKHTSVIAIGNVYNALEV